MKYYADSELDESLRMGKEYPSRIMPMSEILQRLDPNPVSSLPLAKVLAIFTKAVPHCRRPVISLAVLTRRAWDGFNLETLALNSFLRL
jgi:hypothetical protein